MCDEMKIYNAPKDLSGNPYWVPVVVKNRDYLKGFVDSLHFSSSWADFDPALYTYTMSSDRFNDVLRDGRRSSNLTDEEFKDYIRDVMVEQQQQQEYSLNNPKISNGVLDGYYLTLNCTCGNFFGFNTPMDLPNNNMYCDMCSKVVIHYINDDEENLYYDGDIRDVEDVVEQIRKEMDDE